MRLVHRIWGIVALVAFFFYDLVASSLRVAWDVLTPTSYAAPGYLLMPLEAKTDLEITLTANLISLTPGSLSIDVSADRSTLLIHSMFGAAGPEAEIAALKRGMERRVLRATRGREL